MKKRSGNCRGITLVEALISLCLIGVLFGVVILKYRQVARAAQESALKAELVNIRTSIKLFKMFNQRNPDSLREMMDKKVFLPGRIDSGRFSDSIYEQRYLLQNALDADGNKVDAFGNRFVYDRAIGEVRTSTKGYENW